MSSALLQGLEDAVARIFPVDKDMQDGMFDASEGLQEGSRFFVRICELPIDDPLRDLRYGGRWCGEVWGGRVWEGVWGEWVGVQVG